MMEELPEEPVPPKENPIPPPIPAPPPEKSPDEPTISLENLVEDYIRDNLRVGKWTKRTIKEYQNCFRVLKDFLGPDTPVRRIGTRKCRIIKSSS